MKCDSCGANQWVISNRRDHTLGLYVCAYCGSEKPGQHVQTASRTVYTGGGAFIGGNVSTGGGDFVGGDVVKTVVVRTRR